MTGTPNPVRGIDGLASGSDPDNVSKGEFIAFGESRIAQVFTDEDEVLSFDLSAQSAICLLSTGRIYVKDTEELGEADNIVRDANGVAFVAPLIDLENDVTGDLPMSHLNGGTDASSSTFLRGDGVWAEPPTGGGGGGGSDIGGDASTVVFNTSDDLATTPAIDTTTSMTVVPAKMQVDSLGRFFFTVGTPNTTTPGGDYDTLHPFKVPGQPDGLPTYFSIAATLDSSISGDGTNVFNSVVYSLAPSSHGHYAANFTAYVAGTSSGASALAGSVYRTGGTAFCHAQDIQIATDTVSSGGGQLGGLNIQVAQHGGTPRNADFYYNIKSTGTGLGADYGIRMEGDAAISSTGTILGIRSGTSISCANGVDFSGATFSGSAFKSTGFAVNGSGNVVGAQYSIGSNILAQFSSNFHIMYGPGTGAGANIVLGYSSDKSIYLNSDQILFRNTASSTTYGSIGTSGLRPGTDNSLPLGSASLRWTNVFSVAATHSTMVLNGSTSGTLTQQVAAIAGTNTITWPAGTTDFSATGGTSRVVKQTSAGGPFTVAQLAASDLSNTVVGSGAIVLATNPVITGNIGVRGAQTGFQMQSSVGGVGFFVGRSLASNDLNDFFIYDAAASATRMTISSAGLFGFPSSFTANGSVATSLGSVGPTGSHTTVQKWFTISDGSNTYYIPAF